MVNNIVKKEILQAVENQLAENNPECTKQTLDRLMSEGVDEDKAKEMIAVVLLGEMYDMLSLEEGYNEERYCKKLKELKGEEPVELINYEGMTVQEIIKKIEYHIDVFPIDGLQELVRRKDESTPILLDVLKRTVENADKYLEDDRVDYVYAIFLLAQFQVEEAFSLYIQLIKILQNHEDISDEYFFEEQSVILASLSVNKPDLLKSIIKQNDIEDEIKILALEALTNLALNEFITREEVLEFFKTLLNNEVYQNNKEIITNIVSYSNDLYPVEIMEDIRKVYERNLVNDRFIDIEFLEDTLSLKKEDALNKFKGYGQYYLIDDAIIELNTIFDFNMFSVDNPIDNLFSNYDFEEDNYDEDDDDYEYKPIINEPIVKGFKTGRNDPCPCGSGKKYKKCCGKNS